MCFCRSEVVTVYTRETQTKCVQMQKNNNSSCETMFGKIFSSRVSSMSDRRVRRKIFLILACRHSRGKMETLLVKLTLLNSALTLPLRGILWSFLTLLGYTTRIFLLRSIFPLFERASSLARALILSMCTRGVVHLRCTLLIEQCCHSVDEKRWLPMCMSVSISKREKEKERGNTGRCKREGK